MLIGHWVRGKTGNKALGALYSGTTGRILRANVSLSESRLLFPEYMIVEKQHSEIT